MTKVGATYRFEAAHYLPNVPTDHKCRNVHGHNYRVDVMLSGSLDDRGFVIDFAELDNAMQPLVDLLDHRLINDVIENPTAEIIAGWFRERLQDALPEFDPIIRVWETDRYWAEL